MPAEKVARRKKATSANTPKRKDVDRSKKVEKPKNVRPKKKSPSVENVPKSRVAQTGRGAKVPNAEERKAARPARHTLDKQAPNLTRPEAPKRKDGKITETVQVPFAPGTEVQVHKFQDVAVEAARGQRPFGKAVQKVKVTKRGEINLKVDDPGVYSLMAQESKKDPWREVKVPVK